MLNWLLEIFGGKSKGSTNQIGQGQQTFKIGGGLYAEGPAVVGNHNTTYVNSTNVGRIPDARRLTDGQRSILKKAAVECRVPKPRMTMPVTREQEIMSQEFRDLVDEGWLVPETDKGNWHYIPLGLREFVSGL